MTKRNRPAASSLETANHVVNKRVERSTVEESFTGCREGRIIGGENGEQFRTDQACRNVSLQDTACLLRAVGQLPCQNEML